MQKRTLTDIHSHILPGVDDGSPDLACSKRMLACAKRLNIATIVLTPHLRRMRDADALRAAFDQFAPMVQGSGLNLVLGFEVNYSALESRAPVDRCAVEGTRSLLLELPGRSPLPNWEMVLMGLIDAGIMPIIAHPERYAYIQKDIDFAYQLHSLGCELQIDAEALVGLPFSAENRCARAMLKAGLCDYIASDAHRPEDYRFFEKALSKHGASWPESARLHNALADAQRTQRPPAQ